MVSTFKNENHLSIADYMTSYLKVKPPDCSLFSQDGCEISIHKELMYQTKFMRTILETNANQHCCDKLEILCPTLTDQELVDVVHFLYNGEFICPDESTASKALANLTEVFGFPKSLNNVLPFMTKTKNEYPEEEVTDDVNLDSYFYESPMLVGKNDQDYTEEKVPINIAGRRNKKKLVKESRDYEICRSAVFKVLGDPTDLVNFPCEEELVYSLYETQEVSWKCWTNKIKVRVLKSLFKEYMENVGKYPGQTNIRAIREVLDESFPTTLGFGKVFPSEKFTDAYQMHRKRCPYPEPFQDCVFWTLLSRFDQEKACRKKTVSVDDVNIQHEMFVSNSKMMSETGEKQHQDLSEFDAKSTGKLRTESDFRELVRNSVIKVLGNPLELNNYPADEELWTPLYQKHEINWQLWTNKIKVPVLKSLFKEFSFIGKDAFPSQRNVKELREILHNLFPNTLGKDF